VLAGLVEGAAAASGADPWKAADLYSLEVGYFHLLKWWHLRIREEKS